MIMRTTSRFSTTARLPLIHHLPLLKSHHGRLRQKKHLIPQHIAHHTAKLRRKVHPPYASQTGVRPTVPSETLNAIPPPDQRPFPVSLRSPVPKSPPPPHPAFPPRSQYLDGLSRAAPVSNYALSSREPIIPSEPPLIPSLADVRLQRERIQYPWLLG